MSWTKKGLAMCAKLKVLSALRLRTTVGDNRFHPDIETRARSAATGADSPAPRGFVRPNRGMGLVERCRLLLGMVALSAIMTSAAFAEESIFAFSYTTDLLPQGGKEIEQWVTWRHQKNSGSFNMIEGRTELEYGVTDKFQAALYLNYDWTQAFHNGPFGATTPPEQFSDFLVGPDDHFNKTRFVGVSGELIYRIWSPYTDPIGIAVYTEPTIGQNFREVENKIILQKNFFDDLLTLAFNFTYAPELRYVTNDGINYAWQEETDINFTFGASYRFMENWAAGFEFTNEHEYNSYWFNHESNSGYYLGPTIHYGGEHFFATATALWQLPLASTHTDTVPGALVGGFIGDNDFERFRLRIKAGFTW
jgi:hypothetical protein